MTHKKIAAFIACTALLGTVACVQEREVVREQPGHYQHNSSYLDNDGTRYEQEDETVVTRDRHGKRHKSVKSKTTRDPKGMFNKKTTHEYREEDEQK